VGQAEGLLDEIQVMYHPPFSITSQFMQETLETNGTGHFGYSTPKRIVGGNGARVEIIHTMVTDWRNLWVFGYLLDV